MLPVESSLSLIEEKLLATSFLLIRASPGSGKTTAFPYYLFKKKLKGIVLEPRRIAAMGPAHYLCDKYDLEIGQEIGYQVRFESCYSESTRLLYMTEALLLKKIQQDPLLEGIDYIVLDEFHERSVYLDLSLGVLKNLVSKSRPDLKVIIMSATLESHFLSNYLENLEVVDVPGEPFALEKIFDNQNQIIKIDNQWFEKMERLTLKAVRENPTESLLVFVPGKSEGERLSSKVKAKLEHSHDIFFLHGQLSLREQKKIFNKTQKPRLILSTNVAESSLTIPGVSVVVDSGLARDSYWDQDLRIMSLDLKRVSKMNIKQRAGRAAREKPGKVYCAWIRQDELSMPDSMKPEIEKSDLREVCLILSSLGFSNPNEFEWLTKPADFQKAILFLKQWNLIDEAGLITSRGKTLISLPLSIDHGLIVLDLKERGSLKENLPWVILLSYLKLNSPQNNESRMDDRYPLLELIQRTELLNSQFLKELNQVGYILFKQKNLWSKSFDHLKSEDLYLKEKDFILSYFNVYPERLVQRREKHPHKGLLAKGGGIQQSQNSLAKKFSYYLAWDLYRHNGEVFVPAAMSLPNHLFEDLIQNKTIEKIRTEVTVDKGQMIHWKEICYLDLIIESKKTVVNNQGHSKQYLLDFITQNFDEVINSNTHLKQWINRWTFYCNKTNQDNLLSELIYFSIQSLETQFVSWPEAAELDWAKAFEEQLDPGVIFEFNRRCPKEWLPGNGRRYLLNYRDDNKIETQIMLRDLFGTLVTPKIEEEPLLIIILGPHRRPIQVTQNLQIFWKESYPQIKKELRGRYPKHPWPEV